MLSLMNWNWQQPDWPNFSWQSSFLARAEECFLRESGILIGTLRHLDTKEQESLTVEMMSDEALSTSEIEGEILDRASVQSTIRQHLGLDPTGRRVGPREAGIAEMMVDLYRSRSASLSPFQLFR